MEKRRLLAIDPSLTCSGWALFGLGNVSLLGVGKIRSLEPKFSLAERLRDLQRKICLVFEKLGLAANDVLICEAQTTLRDPRAAFKVEQVRGIFEALARQHGLCVPGRINPRSVHYELLGLRGRQLARTFVKQAALRVVEQTYADALRAVGFEVDGKSLKRHQDIVDAILIGDLALTWIRSAEQGGFTLEQFFEQGHRAVRKRVA